ncbi:MAG: diguanylate cyclase [Pirellulaceae bacterium]|jgi:diguanylate cyclase
MPIIIIDALVIAISASVGVGLGCWLRRSRGLKSEPSKDETVKEEVVAVEALIEAVAVEVEVTQERSQLQEERAADILDSTDDVLHQLQELTSSVAADVGGHSSVVRAITEELKNSKEVSGPVLKAVGKLLAANENMEKQLQAAEQRLQQQAEEIELHLNDARTDALTGLANRRVFDEEVAACVAEQREKRVPSSVMMIDVDHFKKFNDTYGHQAGDEVLREVGRVLTKAVEGDQVVCRYGGEEFAVIFPGRDAKRSVVIAERARAAIGKARCEFEGTELKVTASGGLSEINASDDSETIVRRSDDGLYAAKEAGRNNGQWNDGKTNRSFLELMQLGQQEAQAEALKVPNKSDSILDQLPGIDTYQEIIRSRLSEWSRSEEALAVMLVQVDDCQLIEERFGEKGVTLAMQAVATTLKGALRDMDNVCRWNETTFAVLLPKSKGRDSKRIAARIREEGGKCSMRFEEEQRNLTVSVGVSQARFDENHRGDDYESLMGRVYRAVDTASTRGGNLAFIHNGEKTEMISIAKNESA